MARGIFAALEDLEADSAVYGDTPYGETVAHLDVVEEVDNDSGQIDDLSTLANNTQGVIDGLTSIKDSLPIESADTKVVMNDVSIKPTIVAVEALYRKLGIANPVLPSLESFNDNNGKDAVRSLRLSIEEKSEEAKTGIRKVLEKAWNMLKALFEKVMNAIKSVFTPSAERILKNLRTLKATEPKEKEVKDDRLLKAFGKPGSKVTSKDVLDTLERLKAVSEESAEQSLPGHKFTDLPFDTEIENRDNAIIIRSGWDGKTPGDEKVELANKREAIIVLEAVIIMGKVTTSAFKSVKEALEKIGKTYTDNEKVIKESKSAVKVHNELLKLTTKTLAAALDYGNKSYKQIKATEK